MYPLVSMDDPIRFPLEIILILMLLYALNALKVQAMQRSRATFTARALGRILNERFNMVRPYWTRSSHQENRTLRS